MQAESTVLEAMLCLSVSFYALRHGTSPKLSFYREIR